MRALFLGALTRYGVPDDTVRLMVGLPIASLMGDLAQETQRDVQRFLKGTHTWHADGIEYRATVEDVRVTSQPVGAMFDYLLDDTGLMPADRRAAFKGELGILSIGMNTVELLVVQGGSPVQRFTGGRTLGVRRLLELVNGEGLYSLAELDARLRDGALEIGEKLPVWQSEVMGSVEHQWGAAFRRFECVVVVGGGAKLLHGALLTRFKDKAFVPDDPVIATARGLYKYALMREGRRRTRG